MNRAKIIQGYEGRFNPFNYAIGLESTFEDVYEKTLPYPLSKPISPETLDSFIQSLTFFHETVHLAQYVSCSYGLRTLRFTNICLRYLHENQKLKLPVMNSLLYRLLNRDDLNDKEALSLERFTAFLDSADQLRLYTITGIDGKPKESGFELDWEPWSPQHATLSGNPIDPEALIKSIDKSGGLIRRIPIIKMNIPPISRKVLINTAALMEAFATITEIHHIYSALGQDIDFEHILNFLPNSGGYLEAIMYALFNKTADLNTLITTLSACIDIALMYDPFVLYDSPVTTKPIEGKPPDVYPGETFIKACETSKDIPKIKNWTEAPYFYERLCKEMHLPTPKWMAERAFEVASNLASKVDTEHTLMGTAFLLHRDALKIRCNNPSDFPFILPTTKVLFDFIETAAPCVTFYNIHTQQPNTSYEDRLDLIQMHNILLQTLLKDKIDCPLKTGNPFFCKNAQKPENILCMFQDDNGQKYECIADMFDALIS